MYQYREMVQGVVGMEILTITRPVRKVYLNKNSKIISANQNVSIN
jgi:hypothetical protein